MKATKSYNSIKRSRFCISVVLFSGILMLGIKLLLPAFLAYPLLNLLGGSLGDQELLWMAIEIGMYLLQLFLVGAFLLIVFRKNPITPFQGTLSTPKFPFLFIPASLGLFYGLNVAINMAFAEQLKPFDIPIDEAYFPGTLGGVALYCIMISVLPAIFEEWLFRGIMQKNLAPTIGRVPAIVISALVFGLMHNEPAQSVFAFVFGLVAGYAFDKTGSIWFGALIHMVNNAVSFVSTYWYYVYHVEMSDSIMGIYALLCIGVFVVAIPVYTVSSLQNRRKLARMTDEERVRPTIGRIAKMTVLNPLLYVLFGCYCLLIWIEYFYVG